MRYLLVGIYLSTLSLPAPAASFPVGNLQITLYPGAELVQESSATTSTAHRIILGALEKVNNELVPERVKTVRGVKTAYTWYLPEARRTGDVGSFFEQQLTSFGQIIFQCKGRACGSSSSWANTVLHRPLLYGPEQHQRYYIVQTTDTTGFLAVYVGQRATRKIYLHIEFVTVEKEPSASASQEPSAGTSQEPSAGASKEPSASTSQEPSAGASQEPSASASKEPSASASKEPSASASKEPSASASQEPSADKEPVTSDDVLAALMSTGRYVFVPLIDARYPADLVQIAGAALSRYDAPVVVVAHDGLREGESLNAAVSRTRHQAENVAAAIRESTSGQLQLDARGVGPLAPSAIHGATRIELLAPGRQ